MTRFLVAHRTTIAPIAALVLMFVVWELVARAGRIPQYLLPMPSSVFTYTFTNFGLFIPHALGTIQSTLLGFTFSVLFGIGLSIFIVWSRTFEDAIYPLVVMTQVIPKVAIAPLLIVYLGFGQEPKIFLAFLISFFPMVINTTLGMKSVSTELLELLTTLKATRCARCASCARSPSWSRARRSPSPSPSSARSSGSSRPGISGWAT